MYSPVYEKSKCRDLIAAAPPKANNFDVNDLCDIDLSPFDLEMVRDILSHHGLHLGHIWSDPVRDAWSNGAEKPKISNDSCDLNIWPLDLEMYPHGLYLCDSNFPLFTEYGFCIKGHVSQLVCCFIIPYRNVIRWSSMFPYIAGLRRV